MGGSVGQGFGVGAALSDGVPSWLMREYLDSFGNRCWRFTLPGGPFTVRYDALVEMARAPDPVLPDAPIPPEGPVFVPEESP